MSATLLSPNTSPSPRLAVPRWIEQHPTFHAVVTRAIARPTDLKEIFDEVAVAVKRDIVHTKANTTVEHLFLGQVKRARQDGRCATRDKIKLSVLAESSCMF